MSRKINYVEVNREVFEEISDKWSNGDLKLKNESLLKVTKYYVDEEILRENG
ncbi:MAG: hypothetical protein KDH96_02190 [Candidatus Riesia sp.]|nr:hypothetical protein [Candidatus Riesia sp.]